MSEKFTDWMKFFIYDLPAYIINYFKTFFVLLFHPRRTFTNLPASDLMRPKEFLSINILLLYLIGKVIGYELPQFPFKILKEVLQIPFFYGLSTFLLLLLNFAIAGSIFSFLLRLFLKNSDNQNFISVYFPIFCYSTAIYIPFILIKQVLNKIYSSFNINMMSNIVSGIHVNGAKIILELLPYPLILFALLLWWLYLIYIGLKFITNKNKIKRAIALSYISFLIIQLFVTVIAFIALNYSTYKDAHLVYLNETGKTNFTGNPPNYMNAAILTGKIANNRDFPKYIRYIYTLRETVYWMAFYKTNGKIVSKALKDFKEKNYIDVQNVLNLELENCSIHNLIYCPILKEFLKESDKLKRSANFVDFKKRFLNIALSTNLFGIGSGHGTTFDINKISPEQVNITIHLLVPSLISLFP